MDTLKIILNVWHQLFINCHLTETFSLHKRDYLTI